MIKSLPSNDNIPLSFLHINARSLRKHYTEIVPYLQSLEHAFSIIGISESWLSPQTEHLYTLPNYKSFQASRSNRKGGGLILFVNESLRDCSIREELSKTDDNGDYQSIFIEFKINNTVHIVGLYYRPPGKDLNTFNMHFAHTLNLLKSEKRYALSLEILTSIYSSLISIYPLKNS